MDIITRITSFMAAAGDACQLRAGSGGDLFGIPTWYKYLSGVEETGGKCAVSFNFPGDIMLIAAAIIEILLRIAALVAVGFVLYGGVQYIMSQGEPDRLTAARSTIINALIGLAIAVVSIAVVVYVAGRL